MLRLRYALMAVPLLLVLGCRHVEVGVGMNYGPEPMCPYGYYDWAPYNCAPYGYYGPEWFNDGVFIGAGPWFHGPARFRGHVDNHFDVHHGYHGALPAHGERPSPGRAPGQNGHFHGNAVRREGGHHR